MDHVKMLSWAERCLERVEASAETFMRKNPYLSSCKADGHGSEPNTLEYSFTVRHFMPLVPPPKHIEFKIGDALHAFRVSLDYLAVRVVMNAIPKGKESKIAFPIFTNPTDFRANQRRRIPGIDASVHPGLLQAFMAAQPYSGPYAACPTNDPLAILDGLEQPHKHRRMLQALPGPYDFSWSMKSGDPAAVRCLFINDPIPPLGEYQHAEIARFRIDTDASGNLKAEVYGKTRFFVCFDEKGPAAGAPVVRTLKEMRDRIGNDIFPLFDQFV